ncbi:AAA family ATPase [Nitrosovibrio sp. Nv17]|uniref:AAA family ATPase n=1 Tax=Nitrosovibrio sp. Nv17 TaxID=1855339 RepID=UPI0009089680|nr:AAA family ATPase [Nitrosovibrio sp. Nv17]SFW33091.1 Type II secretory pathway, component ExeA (predicted ATPase) [Nitrosovibrio sp. Nv17]
MMTLGHFGLYEQLRASGVDATPFFEGGGRGATLDALIYMLVQGEGAEGMIQLTGGAGSGKTVLCKVLSERLPVRMRPVYLDVANLPENRLLQAFAETLHIGLPDAAGVSDEEFSDTVIDGLQHALIEKYAHGGRVVWLVDGAHALSPEALEAIRRLDAPATVRCNPLRIILAGRLELDHLLANPSMRPLRDRIAHRLDLPMLDDRAVGAYLGWRMRAAGHPGPGMFAPKAVSLIATISGGVIGRIGLLADKSLEAARSEGADTVKTRHVRAIMGDCGIRHPPSPDTRLIGAGAALAIAILVVTGWQMLQPASTAITSTAVAVTDPSHLDGELSSPLPDGSSPVVALVTPSAPPAAQPPAELNVSPVPSAEAPSNEIPPPVAVTQDAPVRETMSAKDDSTAATGQAGTTVPSHFGGIRLADYPLLAQRIRETEQVLAAADRRHFTIQLFVTESVLPDRMERFLGRAERLVNLAGLYIHPVIRDGQAGFRVSYGIYPDREQAATAMAELPSKYREDFRMELYTMDDLR